MASHTASAAPFRVIGLCAAPYTPFKDTDEAVPPVDFDAIAEHVEELLRQGVKYAFVCGSTGEGVTMSVDERKRVLERWLEASAGRITIIAHVGAESVADMVELARHAESTGAAGIAAMPTTYNKPPSLDVIVDLLAMLSAAAPSKALYYYHIAIKTGVHIRCDKLLEKVHAQKARIPTFRGIKFTDFDMHIFANCVAFADGEYDILSGRDEVLLAALAMGGKGAVGSTYNYMGRLYNDLIAAFNKGDMATAYALQRRSQININTLMSDAYGAGVNTGKATMELRLGGKHTGPPRHPWVRMSAEGKAKLKADLDAMGFFSW